VRALIGFFLGFSSWAALSAVVPADTVYRHGTILTLDAHDSVAQALAVRDGRIAYVGDEAGVTGHIGRDTKVVDLGGRVLMPGLVDGHMHPLQGGDVLVKCNLNYEALTVPQFQARIQACLDKTRDQEPDGWLIVVSWFQNNMLPSGVETTFATLDGLKTRRPILVESSFGHSTLANSRAIRLAGINAGTRDPLGGRIARDAKGNPAGLFEDSAQSLFDHLLPKSTPADDLKAARAALKAIAQQGITGFLDAVATPEALGAFTTLQKQGELTARAHFAPLIEPADAVDPARAVARVKALATRYDQGPIGVAPGITVRNAKLFMDGVITAPAFTGNMLEPYRVNRGTEAKPEWVPGKSRGPDVYFPAPALASILIGLAEVGIDPHMHADGDGAVRAALNAVQTMRERVPRLDVRPAIAHNEVVDPADYPRYARLDVTPVLSFQWEKPATDTIDGARDFLGPQRFRFMEPAGVLQAAGARIAYGSDWPVDRLDEWFALKVGVTRTNEPGVAAKYAGRLGDDPGLSRQSVLRAITLNSSHELRQEALTGSLEVGKLADMIVLDRNPLTIPAEDIAHVRVLQTLVGGRAVYSVNELSK